MRGESARRAVTRGEDLLTGRDRVDGDRYQVDTVGGGGGFCGTWGAGRGLWTKMVASLAAAGLSGGNWPLQVSLAAIGRCRSFWRQLSAAGLSGGQFWPLQVSLAAIGRCRSLWRRLSAAGPL